MKAIDDNLLIDIFFLTQPAKKKDRRKFLRDMIRLNPDHSKVPAWRAELGQLINHQ